MGDSRSRIADDLDDYESFCDRLNIQNRGYGIYSHYDEIFKKIEVHSMYEFNQKLEELTKSGWDLNHIKDFYQIS